MSKAIERAMEVFPHKKDESEFMYSATEKLQQLFVIGYKHGEKEMIDKAAEWFRIHWREYIMGPDANGCVGFGLWENDFRKAMEED